MNALFVLAAKEIKDGLRNRWALSATLLLAGLALALAFLGSAPTGHVGVPPLSVTVVSLASLTVFLVPLIALILSYDALVGEIERGTMLLLLAYPVRRWQVVAGKFTGHAALLGTAIVTGYGLAGAAVVLLSRTRETWQPFLALVGGSVLLGMAFLALGYLLSIAVRERATAAGLAVGLWLLLVLLFDMGLLGLLAASEGRAISAAALKVILLFDPADVFRLLALTSFPEIRQYSGLAGLPIPAVPPAWLLLAAMGLWIAAPLGLAAALLSRRQL